MEILVDADACPVKQIIVRIASQYHIPVTMFIDTSHELNDGYSKVVIVDKGAESVDIALVNQTKKGDIVVTQDYGLAAMIMSKGGHAINQNGLIFTDDNIDSLLTQRHFGHKIRLAGGRSKGPAKRTKENDRTFEENFASLLAKYVI